MTPVLSAAATVKSRAFRSGPIRPRVINDGSIGAAKIYFAAKELPTRPSPRQPPRPKGRGHVSDSLNPPASAWPMGYLPNASSKEAQSISPDRRTRACSMMFSRRSRNRSSAPREGFSGCIGNHQESSPNRSVPGIIQYFKRKINSEISKTYDYFRGDEVGLTARPFAPLTPKSAKSRIPLENPEGFQPVASVFGGFGTLANCVTLLVNRGVC